MEDRIDKTAQELHKLANQHYEFSEMYKKQNRIKEQQYHLGRCTGLRDAATRFQIDFL